MLILTPRLPYPPDDGGAIVMYQTLRRLQQAGVSVTLASLNTLKHRANPAELEKEVSQVLTTGVDTTPRPLAALKAALFSQTPYNILRFDNEAHRQALAQLLQKETFDLIQLEGVYLAVYLPVLRKHSAAPVILRAHNVEYKIWERMAENEPSFFKKKYYQHLAKGGERFEKEHFNHFDGIAAITAEDEKQIRQLGYRGAMVSIPAGTEIAPAPIAVRQAGKTVGFLGSLEWLPNVQGLRWFLSEVWPLVLAAEPEARFELAGKNPLPEVEQWQAPRYTLRGRVENAAHFLQSLDVAVIPLLSGSGMRVKLIESMAQGLPVVSTQTGAEGVPITNEQNVFLADAPAEFAQKIVRLLQNPTLRTEMGAAAYRFAQQNYDWPSIAQRFLDFYGRWA